ncbi:MAG TPA: hypothetical protein VF516_14890 [Kofleriaceae bacterium]
MSRSASGGRWDPVFGWVSAAQRREADLFYADLVGRPARRPLARARFGEAADDASEAIDVNDSRRKTFREMWDLIVKFRWQGTPAVFTNDLILCICWEESTFLNIWQQNDSGALGPAKGFGQLEPSALALIRRKFAFTESVAELQRLMDQDAFSVQFIGRVLHTLFDNLRAQYPSLRSDDEATKRSALLNGYAGYLTDHAQWRKDIVDGWYAAERLLVAGHGPSGYPTRTAAQQALDAATPANRKMRDRAAWTAFLAQLCQTLPDP